MVDFLWLEMVFLWRKWEVFKGMVLFKGLVLACITDQIFRKNWYVRVESRADQLVEFNFRLPQEKMGSYDVHFRQTYGV